MREAGLIYPCDLFAPRSARAAAAPHAEEEEPIYPGTCRPACLTKPNECFSGRRELAFPRADRRGARICRRLRRPAARRSPGVDFGDFVIWRKDDVPAYQLAVVVDDAAMEITEVVRGADLLLSTFRQLLLYRALALPAPEFCHVPLVLDSLGKRLAKRHDALSLRALRARGFSADVRHNFCRAGASLRRTWATERSPRPVHAQEI